MEDELRAVRDTFTWGTSGKYQDKPLKWIILSKISDSHLLHIIAWIKEHPHDYFVHTLLIMEAEQAYRTKNMIFIAEYDYYDDKQSI